MTRIVKYLLFIALILVAAIFHQYLLPDLQARYNHQKILQDVDTMVAEMSLQEKVGQMLFPEFSGRTLNLSLERLLAEVQPGGLIFFPYNLSGLTGTRGLVADLHNASPYPLFIAIDQEGGLIQKLKEGVPQVNDFPGAMAVGATGSPTLSYELARTMGAELKAVGFNMVFAPVLDTNSNPDNPVIGIRSFGSDPDLVAEMGVAFMDGLNREGLIPVGKHFPGHGDTSADSHLGTAMIPYDMKRLEKVELLPFTEAITNGIPALMTAHITIPKVVPSGKPATLSPEILTDLLREKLGYEGLVITDAMNMKAISSHFGQDDSVVQAVQAGADLILMPIDPLGARNALVSAVQQGNLTEERIDESVKRILYLKVTKGLFQPITATDEPTGSVWKQGREKAQEVADQAVTVIKDDHELLPVKLTDGQKILVLTPIKSVTATYLEELKKVYATDQVAGFTANKLSLTASQWQQVEEADVVLVATNSRTPSTRQASYPQMQTVARIGKLKPEQMIWVSLQTPYELSTWPEMGTYLAQYGYNPVNSRAMIRMITGQVKPQGQLPVNLPKK